jgi:arginine:agmatine antiporter
MTKIDARDGKIGVGLAAMLVTGNIVGSGVYLLPAVLAGVGGISLIGWAAALIGALILAAMFSGFASQDLDSPNQEGLIGRIADGLGPFWGYQAAALYSVACWVGNVAIALSLTGYAASFFPELKTGPACLGVTVIAILAMTALNLFGSRLVGRLQGATLLVGLAPVVLIGVAGWFVFNPALFAAQWNVSHGAATQVLGATVLPIFWAFLGMESAVVCAVRVRDPARNIAPATMIGVAVAGTLYAGACVVLLGVLPAKALSASTAPFAEGAQAILGFGVGAMVALCAMIRAAGVLAGWILMAAETAQSAAASGLFPTALAMPGSKATRRTLLVMAAIMIATTLLSVAPGLAQQFTLLIDVATLLSLGMYILAAAALWRLCVNKGTVRGRAFIRATCALTIVFCGGVLVTSDRIQLAWSVGVAIVAGLAYAAGLRGRQAAAAQA